MTQKKMMLITAILATAIGAYVFYDFLHVLPWHDTWWTVQETGVNWSGDTMRNLHTFTFTEESDGTITVTHRVQSGLHEAEGSLSGTGTIDGGLLVIHTETGDKKISYNRFSKTVTIPLTDAKGDTLILEPLTDENQADADSIRQDIIATKQKPENQIDTTIAAGRI